MRRAYNGAFCTSQTDDMATKTEIKHFDDAAQSYEKLTGGCTRELAQYIVGLTSGIGHEPTVLDNACGPAIVTEVFLHTVSHSNIPHVIYAVDAAPAMIEAARSKLGSTTVGDSVRFDVMQAEKLRQHFHALLYQSRHSFLCRWRSGRKLSLPYA